MLLGRRLQGFLSCSYHRNPGKPMWTTNVSACRDYCQARHRRQFPEGHRHDVEANPNPAYNPLSQTSAQPSEYSRYKLTRSMRYTGTVASLRYSSIGRQAMVQLRVIHSKFQSLRTFPCPPSSHMRKKCNAGDRHVALRSLVYSS